MPRMPYVDGAMVRDATGRWMNHGSRDARTETLTRDVRVSGAARAGNGTRPPGRAMDAGDANLARAVCDCLNRKR